MSYKFDHEWAHERERLSKLESGMDPGTIRMLETINIQRDWSCLELGAGGGSIAAWLAQRLGPAGSLVATDLQTSFVEALGIPNIDVRVHDIVTDPLPAGAYDLIHSRAVLEHLPGRAEVAEKLVKGLKPGGCLMLESHDFLTLQHIEGGDPAQFMHVIEAFLNFMAQSGFDAAYGRSTGKVLRDLGLKNVQVEGRAYELGGDRALTGVLSLVLRRLQAPMVAAGLVADEDIDAISTGLERGEIVAQSPMIVAACGWK